MLHFKGFAIAAAVVFAGISLIGQELKFNEVISKAKELSAAKKNLDAAIEAEKAYQLKGITPHQKSTAAYLAGLYYFWSGKRAEADRILTKTLQEDQHTKGMIYEINSVHFNVLINTRQYDRMNQALAAMEKINPKSKDFLAKKAKAEPINRNLKWEKMLKPIKELSAAKKYLEAAAEAEKLYQTEGLTSQQKASAAYFAGVAFYRAGKHAEADRVLNLALQEKNLSKSLTCDICSSYFGVLLSLGQKDRAEKILETLKKNGLPDKELQKLRERLNQ